MPDDSAREIDDEKYEEAVNLAQDPTKHFVRVNGWLPFARKRLEAIRTISSDREGLRYLTLCGPETVDIFHLLKNNLLFYDARGFPGVVFVEHKPAPFADAHRRLGKTIGFNQTFEKSMLNNPEFHKKFPFDLINLDFSGVCFPKKEPPLSDTLRALKEMFSHQEGTSFTLFVTFRADRSRENEGAVQELIKTVQDNIDNHTNYRDIYQKNVKLSPPELATRDYAEFLSTAFPKVILSYSSRCSFLGKLCEVYRYARPSSSGNIDIVKFIFEFEKQEINSVRGEVKASRAHSANYIAAICQAIWVKIMDVTQELTSSGGLASSLGGDLQEVIIFRDNFDPFKRPSVS